MKNDIRDVLIHKAEIHELPGKFGKVKVRAIRKAVKRQLMKEGLSELD